MPLLRHLPLALALLLASSTPGRATCDAIPSAQERFRGALGIVDRPFAGPGDVVDLRLDPACHGRSPGLPATPGEVAITLVFTPPAAPPHAVVLAPDCLGFAAAGARCEQRLAGGTATCLPAGDAIALVDVDGERRLRLRIPETDALLVTPGDPATAADGRGFTGPAAIAVTRADDPLPCGLAAGRCRDVLGVTACVDELFLDDGECGALPHPVFAHFTVLPRANDFQALCTTGDARCTGLADEVALTVDRDGNLLLPMDWRGVLERTADVPVPRLLRGSAAVEAVEGSGVPLALPDADPGIGSFSVRGTPLPPIFTPQRDPDAADAVGLFGSADAPEGVLRIARRRTCDGGPRAALPCARDGDCPEGACGPGRFDFGTRLAGGTGPLVLKRDACLGGARPLATCASAADCPGGQCLQVLHAEAADPVPLDGLNTTTSGFAFVVDEALLDEDRNGDGDRLDDVVELIDAASGLLLPIGDGAEGRAVLRLHEPPFTRPALTAAGDVVAFLVPEAHEGDRDADLDGDRVDTLVRAYRLAGRVAEPLAGDVPLVADAAPLIDGQPLAISGGRLFFRTPEAAAARRTTRLLTRRYTGERIFEPTAMPAPQAVSADGRFVAFVTYDDLVVPGDVHCSPPSLCRDAFLLDRDADGNGHLDDPAGTFTVRASPSEPRAPTNVSVVSADGSCTAFISYAAMLVPGDTNRAPDVFVRERDGGAIERVSVGPGGAQAALGVIDAARGLAISADGQVIAFASVSPDLVAGDTNASADVFVHDRRTGTTERVSVGPDGHEARTGSFVSLLSGIALSADGRLVAFDSDAADLVPGDTNGVADVFVRDRALGTTRRISVGVRGEEANGPSRMPAMGGGVVAFTSVATNLVPGATRGRGEIYVHDLATAATSLASVASDGRLPDLPSAEPAVSADGRVVAFASHATTLVADDRNNIEDVFAHDRLTGTTERASLTFDGREPQQAPGGSTASSSNPALTGDGRTALLVCTEDLAEGEQAHRAVYARMPDPGDDAADLTHDGRQDATVLRVLPLGAPAGAPQALCPAGPVALAGETAVFLRPEAAGDAPGCPAGPVLNGDGDADDLVVHVALPDGEVRNLGIAATAVAASSAWVAALVPESGQGEGPSNGDGDTDDLVLHVQPLTPLPGWTNLGVAADAVWVRGDQVVFVVPEAAQGAVLNGDGDRDDRVLHVADARTGSVRSLGWAVEEVVVGDRLVAFRTREDAQGQGDLNGDGDTGDGVLSLYDLATGALYPTGSAVTPCRLAACDPRLPFRVLEHSVRFLTLEADQRDDLNGDGDDDDLVLQTFRVPADGAGAPAAAPARAAARAGGSRRRRAVAAVAAGRCSTTGAACALDDACAGGGRCIVPPGICFRDLGVPCRPGVPEACGPGQACVSDADAPRRTTCRAAGGACTADADCGPGARCTGSGVQVARLVTPLAADDGPASVLPAVGRCIDPGSGAEGGFCRVESECRLGWRCRDDLVSVAIGDRDGDEVPDPVDVCPTVFDPDQADLDDDGVGDPCDARTPGNGVRESGEQCDGPDDAACPGQCRPDATCRCTDEPLRGAQVRVGRAGDARGFAVRVRLPLASYAGDRVLLRLEDAAGQVVAAGGVPALPTVQRDRLWRAMGQGSGLELVEMKRLAGSGGFRLHARARRWIPADAARWATLTITAGDRCFTVRRRHVPEAPSTTTRPSTSTTTSSTSTTTTSSSTSTTTTLPPDACCGAHRMVLEVTGDDGRGGGSLRAGALGPFALEPGTRIVLDVGPPDGACRHAVTIPPGGFDMPAFCLQPTGLTADFAARGCAAGDALGRGSAWDGAAPAPDADVTIVGDTSDGACNPVGQACSAIETEAGANRVGREQVTVGDGEPDPPGFHVAFDVPVRQLAWDVREPVGTPPVCPDADGVPAAVGEAFLAAYTTLRITTATASARFVDVNGDGCAKVASVTPDEALAATGAPAPGPCCEVGQRLTLAGSTIAYTDGVLGDLSTALELPVTVVACEPVPATPATCEAVSGGGRVVTAIDANADRLRAVLPVAGGKVVAAGVLFSPDLAHWSFALARYDAEGRLDPSFGTDGSGRATADLGAIDGDAAAALDGDGRIVIGGSTDDGEADFVVARFDADGRLDASFGQSGRVRIDLGGVDRVSALVVQADGRIVLAGSTRAAADQDSALVRLRPDGTLDASFGAAGVVVADLGAADQVRALALGQDDAIVIAGDVGGGDDARLAVARVDPDGRLDGAFADGGVAETDLGPAQDFASAVIVLPGGDVIAAGGSQRGVAQAFDAVLVRYRTDGTLDSGFGQGGVVRAHAADGDGAFRAAAVQPDGRLVAVGRSGQHAFQTPGGEHVVPPVRWLAARADAASGALDETFGDGGLVTTWFGGFRDEAYAVAVLPDGRLVAGGGFNDTGRPPDDDFALARWTSAGRPDPTFGGQCSWERDMRFDVLPGG